MKAYDEDVKYILFINKSIIILGCSTVNSLTIGFLGYIFQQMGARVKAYSENPTRTTRSRNLK